MNFDINLFRGLTTLALLAAFTALAVWVAHPRNKHRFDAAANLPLEDGPLEHGLLEEDASHKEQSGQAQ